MPDQLIHHGENRRNVLQKILGMGAGLAASSELLSQQPGDRPASSPQTASPAAPAETVLFAFDDRWLPLQHGLRLNLVSYQSAEGGPVTNMAVPPGPPGAPDS